MIPIKHPSSYIYQFKASSGSSTDIIKGEHRATSPYELYTFLKDKNLLLISYKKKSLSLSLYRNKKTLKTEELRDFFFHLSNFLLLGVPILEAIRSMLESPYSKSISVLLVHLETALENGLSFAQSFEKAPLRLAPLIYPLLHIAEKTGTLPLVCKELFMYFKEKTSSQKAFKKAFRYPLILLSAICLACGSLLFFLVPELTKFLTLTHQTLPFSIIFLIKIKHLFLDYGSFLLGGAVSLYFLFKIGERSDFFQSICTPLSYKLPFLGKLKLLQAQTYFINAFALLLTHHIPFHEALLTLEKIAPSLFLQKDLRCVLSAIEEGKKPSTAFQNSFYNTVFFHKMLVIGESSNSLKETLSLGSQYSMATFQEMNDRLIGKLEPALTLFLGIILLWIASTFILPLYDSLLSLDTYP